EGMISVGTEARLEHLRQQIPLCRRGVPRRPRHGPQSLARELEVLLKCPVYLLNLLHKRLLVEAQITTLGATICIIVGILVRCIGATSLPSSATAPRRPSEVWFRGRRHHRQTGDLLHFLRFLLRVERVRLFELDSQVEYVEDALPD